MDGRTLLKIDIEGAEYDVLRVIAPLLAEHKPWLHVSFHPFNLVARGDAYHNALLRLRCALSAAEALAPYRFMHLYGDGGVVHDRPGGADGFPAAISVEREAGAAHCDAAIRLRACDCILRRRVAAQCLTFPLRAAVRARTIRTWNPGFPGWRTTRAR